MIARDKLHALFEYRDGVLYNRVNRGRRAKAGQSTGTRDAYGYLVVTIDRKVHKAHRIVYAMFHDEVPAVLDHINGDPSDNRIENLRPATARQNGYNRKVSAKSTTQVKNVHPLRGKWVALCQANGVRRYLGLYDDIENAIEAVTAFRKINHKEFARHD